MSARLRLIAWAAGLLTAGLLLILLARGAGVSWDPLGLEDRRRARLEAERDRALAEARARALEIEGRAEAAARSAGARAATRAAETAVRRHRQEMTDDPTPSPPLDADRRDRLRRLDDELCRISPALAGCDAAAD